MKINQKMKMAIPTCMLSILAITSHGKVLANDLISSNVYEEQSTNQQKQRKITGVINDDKGEPIIGASILEKGAPNNGTITDMDGKFSINVDGKELQISYIGYIPQNVILKPDVNAYNIIMKEDVNVLDELVVVGYGVQKKANLTGSVGSVDSRALESRPIISVSSALAGQVSGLTSIQGSGAPGSQYGTITIRGKNSINAASPLVIIDGIPGAMDNIDPSDIASISVLKDAASSAIYGVQAANGVILITTKQGKKDQKVQINYSGMFSWTSPVAKPNYLNAYNHAVLYNEAVHNDNPNSIQPFSDEDIEKYHNGILPSTDWYRAAFKKYAFEQLHNVSFNGGSNSSTYSASVGFAGQDGLTDDIDYKRYNARLNLNSDINKYLTLGLNGSGFHGVRNDGWKGYASVMQGVARAIPTDPIYNEDGSYFYSGKDNPVAVGNGKSGHKRTTIDEISATGYAMVKILPELNVKGVFSYRHNTSQNDNFKKHLTYGNDKSRYDSGLREAEKYRTEQNYYTTQLLANYNKTFGFHSIGVLGGIEGYRYRYSRLETTRKGGGNNELDESMSTLDASSQTNKDISIEVSRLSYFGRIQYDFKDKYLFEANVRADGSSKFAKGNRWGTFPAFSAGWRIAEEAFIKDNINWISNLKLRLGWGKTGNEELNYYDVYPSVPTYSYGTYMFGDNLYTTISESRLINNKLKWATVTNYELGLESGFFNNRVGFELALYKKETKDMLLNLPILGIIGMSAPYQNAGKVENTGFDLDVFHNNQINKDWSYSMNFNLAYVRNKITDLKGLKVQNPNNDKNWWIEGYSISSLYGYVANGYFNTEEELKDYPKRTGKEKLGDIKYVDFDDDGKITANDRQILGSQNFPSWTTGLTLASSYKEFDFSAFFQGVFGVKKYIEQDAAWAFYNGGPAMEKHLDRWTPENHNASYPRVTATSQDNYVTSSFWFKNGSYVRLKSIVLGYTLPNSLNAKIGTEKIRLFVSGENLFTITGLEDIDPEETSTRGWSYNNVKKITFGLKVSF